MRAITVAICSYNSATRLPGLVEALRSETCPIPFEILIVDNNSTDHTSDTVRKLSSLTGPTVRSVHEIHQGIPYARNRALEEAQHNDFFAFIDSDELPSPGWLTAAVDALEREGAECVGGPIRVRVPDSRRPPWLTHSVLGFLGELDHGPEPFWITSAKTPIWSGNVAYRTSVFMRGLRFDERYNRAGKGIGGGSDGILFRALLNQGIRIRYRPDMAIQHFVDSSKLRISYFLRLHYVAGRKFGQFEAERYPRAVMGVPPFLVHRAIRQWGKALWMLIQRDPGTLRQAMNGAYAVGTAAGLLRRWHRGENN